MSYPTEYLVRLQANAPMELRAKADGAGDGNTLVGHFAVFNTWTEIHSFFEGDFLERIAPTAFDETFASRRDQIRVLYDHGHDPDIGQKPLGVPDVLRSDAKGAYYEVSLYNEPYVNQLKSAIRTGQMGASFRFSVTGESWNEPSKPTNWNPAKLPERTIDSVQLFEFGPVTFPAYTDATAGLRSGTDEWHDCLMKNPKFLSRFIARVGPKNAAEILTSAAGASPARSTTHAGASPSVDSGRLVAACTTTSMTLKGRYK